MREIKFRAWVKDQKRMENCIELSPFHVGDCDRFRWNHDEIELMQYTGLKDTNEKEVFESDIIKSFTQIGEVKYELGVYYVEWMNENYKSYLSDAIRNGEVIGNIYSNPELIQS